MLTKFLRAFLSIVENPRALPSFIMLYITIWLFWHYPLLTKLLLSSESFIVQLNNTPINDFHFVAVLLTSIFLFAVYFAFQTFIKYSREHVDRKDKEANDGLTLQEKQGDIEQLVATLEAMQVKLVTSQDNEKKAKNEVRKVMEELIRVRSQLEEANADIAIMKSSIL